MEQQSTNNSAMKSALTAKPDLKVIGDFLAKRKVEGLSIEIPGSPEPADDIAINL